MSRAMRGFTLIELLIAIVVVGILMSIAVAGYGTAMQKTRRGAAQACLMEAAQFMERFRTTNMTYAGAAPDPQCANDLAGFYTFGFNGTPDADEFEIQAVPQGSQADDTQCGTLSLDQAGTKGATGTAGPVGCW